jgi:Nose resistant-to-fluoxetine protein, N-terminal domain
MFLKFRTLTIVLSFLTAFAVCNESLNVDQIVTKFNQKIVNEKETREKSGNNSSCIAKLELLSTAFSNGEIWAVQIFDAWSKLQSGIFSGNVANYGHFDQCVRSRHDMKELGNFQGQHCVISYQGHEQLNRSEQGDNQFVFDLSRM